MSKWKREYAPKRKSKVSLNVCLIRRSVCLWGSVCFTSPWWTLVGEKDHLGFEMMSHYESIWQTQPQKTISLKYTCNNLVPSFSLLKKYRESTECYLGGYRNIRNCRNKANYTAQSVLCNWAEAVIQKMSRKCLKSSYITNWPTNQLSNKPTNQHSEEESHACN